MLSREGERAAKAAGRSISGRETCRNRSGWSCAGARAPSRLNTSYGTDATRDAASGTGRKARKGRMTAIAPHVTRAASLTWDIGAFLKPRVLSPGFPHGCSQSSNTILELLDQFFLVATFVGAKHNFARRQVLAVCDVKEVTDIRKQNLLPLLNRKVLADHDHPVVLPAIPRLVDKLCTVF